MSDLSTYARELLAFYGKITTSPPARPSDGEHEIAVKSLITLGLMKIDRGSTMITRKGEKVLANLTTNKTDIPQTAGA